MTYCSLELGLTTISKPLKCIIGAIMIIMHRKYQYEFVSLKEIIKLTNRKSLLFLRIKKTKNRNCSVKTSGKYPDNDTHDVTRDIQTNTTEVIYFIVVLLSVLLLSKKKSYGSVVNKRVDTGDMGEYPTPHLRSKMILICTMYYLTPRRRWI